MVSEGSRASGDASRSRAASRFLDDDEGLSTVEYAIAGALVAGAVVLAFDALGMSVANVIEQLAQALS